MNLTTVETVRLLSEEGLDWNLSVDTGELLEVIPVLKKFNKERGANVLQGVQDIDAYLKGNSKRGARSHSWIVGREGALVLYLKVPRRGLPAEFDYEGFSLLLKGMAEFMSCIQSGFMNNRPIMYNNGLLVYSFWWD